MALLVFIIFAMGLLAFSIVSATTKEDHLKMLGQVAVLVYDLMMGRPHTG
jgi:hypothetical protein